MPYEADSEPFLKPISVYQCLLRVEVQFLVTVCICNNHNYRRIKVTSSTHPSPNSILCKGRRQKTQVQMETERAEKDDLMLI